MALGEPRRGASLLVTYLVVGVCTVFTALRPTWQVAVLALLAGPIALLCNLLRFLCWGGIAIYMDFDAVSPWPRAMSVSSVRMRGFPN